MNTRRTSTFAPGDRDLLGLVADFTVGTAVVLWHLVLADRDRRRRRAPARLWSSTR